MIKLTINKVNEISKSIAKNICNTEKDKILLPTTSTYQKEKNKMSVNIRKGNNEAIPGRS